MCSLCLTAGTTGEQKLLSMGSSYLQETFRSVNTWEKIEFIQDHRLDFGVLISCVTEAVSRYSYRVQKTVHSRN